MKYGCYLFAVVVCYSYTSTTSTPTSATAPSGSATATVKSPRPASPASNMVVLPSGSTVYVKSECQNRDSMFVYYFTLERKISVI